MLEQKQNIVELAQMLREKMTAAQITYRDIQLVTIRKKLNNGDGYAPVTIRRAFDKTPYRKNKKILAIAEKLIAEKHATACE